MINYRPARSDEISRAAGILKPLHSHSACFVAISDEPIERIVGVAFWHVLETDSQDRSMGGSEQIAEFSWRMIPRWAGTSSELEFLVQLQAHLAKVSPASLLKSEKMHTPNSVVAQTLTTAGFEIQNTTVRFEETYEWGRDRLKRLRRIFGNADASGLLVKSPDASHVLELQQLLADQERLISPREIRATFTPIMGIEPGFDPAWSTVLIEENSGRLVGAQLVKFEPDFMITRALAVTPLPDRGAGLGWFLLAERWIQRCEERNWSGSLYFRTNPVSNPTMFKMACALGYNRLGEIHSYGIKLH